MKMKIFNIIFALFVIFAFNSCLKNPVNNPPQIDLNSSVELLSYIEESTGDYVNTDNFPSLINAQNVYNNLGNYLIIDVRSKEKFTAGHIQNSINITPDSLLIYMKSIQPANYTKIVIVSSTGQSASYYCCLMILDGFSNTYAMRYGMASWNNVFTAPWMTALSDPDSAELKALAGGIIPKAGYSPLPILTYPDQNADNKSKLEYRITKLLNEGFDDELASSYSTPVTDFQNLLVQREPGSYYCICLGVPHFYWRIDGGPSAPAFAHPLSAVNYLYYFPYFEFASVNYLQTLPSDREICLYSYSGFISAFLTAYLRVLGYNSKSILFGGNNLYYNNMLNTASLNQYVFTPGDINNFPFVTGN